MNCDVIQDLIPLYVDGCCSPQTAAHVKAHLQQCAACKAVYDAMSAPCQVVTTPAAPTVPSRVNDWKASILQSVLLLVSFGFITVGVALEADTPSGLMNGYWAANVVIPATGFLLSLTNWYFVRLYKSRKTFSNFSLLITVALTFLAHAWARVHYDVSLLGLLSGLSMKDRMELMVGEAILNGPGLILMAVSFLLSKVLSNQFAKMMGKE